MKLERRSGEWNRLLAERAARVQTRHQLAAREAYPTEPVELSLLQPARAAHEAKLRAARDRDGQPLLNRLHHGRFTVETDAGHLRQLWLDGLPFGDFTADAAELATAFAKGSGFGPDPAAVRLVLQDLTLLDHRTDEAVAACFAMRMPGAQADSTAGRHGIEALLRRLTEIDEALRRERPGLDVPLREGLRLAALWADPPAEPVHQTAAP